jgi:sigma-B regulation protein RsbU (phosphoserine phosphatase)
MTVDPARTSPKRLAGSGPAPSIGFLTDWLGNTPYQWQVLRGVRKEANGRGAHLLCFVGGALAPPDRPTPANAVFELARPSNADGLLLLSSSLGNEVGVEGLRAFCEGLSPMPLCSIAVALSPHVSSVCPDNETGMRIAVEHLIQVHGIQRIAFVRGPAASDEAESRLRVYRETLSAHGIPHSEELIVPGDFSASAGRDAVHTLFVDRALTPNSVGAIVASNDLMALGVLEALQTRGIRVPEQIAVSGFDDVPEAAFAVPPLTTVRQKLEELGRDGVRLLLDQIGDSSRPEQIVRPTELVTRRSCGCFSGYGVSYKSSGPPGAALGFDAAILRRRHYILADMARAARGNLGAAGSQWEVRLLNAVAEQVRGDSPDAFSRAYDDLLRRLIVAGSDISVCNDVLSALRPRVIRAISDPKLRIRAEDFFHEARIKTCNALEGVQAATRARAWNDALVLMNAGAAIMACTTIAELARAVHEHLPAAGIPRCFIAQLHERPGAPAFARLVIAEKPGVRKSDATMSVSYPLHDVLRRAVLSETDEQAYAVFPATFANGDRAVLVVQLGDMEAYAYEALRTVFTSALSRLSG